MFAMDGLEMLADSLVREHLSRKGWKKTLRVLDEESPRREDSISSRQALAKSANIERLMKKNKTRDSPLKTMIEVMTLYFIEQLPTDKQPSHSHTQKLSKKTDHPQPVTSSEMPRPLIDQPQPVTSSQTSHPTSTLLQHPIKTKSQSEETEKIMSTIKKRDFQMEENRHLSKERSRVKDAVPGAVMSTGHNLVGERRDVKREKRKRMTDNPFVSEKVNEWGVEFGGSGIQVELELESVPGLVDGGREESGVETAGGRSRNVDVREESVVGLVCEDIEDEEVGGIAVGYKPTVSFESSIRGQPLDIHTAMALKTLLFGSGTVSFNAEWQRQSFTFCDLPGLEYGLVQIKGGPCGVLASVQAFVIKHLLFSQKQTKQNGKLEPNDAERRSALCSSLVEILWKCGAMQKACVVKASVCAQFGAIPGKYKADRITEYFENSSGNGVILFLYSALLSRGLKQVCEDMDEAGNRLMGMHGYCNQEMVNLFLSGVASSNVFNDQIELDAGGSTKLVLKGIQSQSDIGFLSLFEHYGSCQVGSFLKSPMYPAWVVCSESHFSVLFSMDREILTDWKLGRRFDLFYYDGLAQQDEVIRLTVDTTKKSKSIDTDLVPPLEHCIRTKWLDASVDWNGSEPIL